MSLNIADRGQQAGGERISRGFHALGALTLRLRQVGGIAEPLLAARFDLCQCRAGALGRQSGFKFRNRHHHGQEELTLCAGRDLRQIGKHHIDGAVEQREQKPGVAGEPAHSGDNDLRAFVLLAVVESLAQRRAALKQVESARLQSKSLASELAYVRSQEGRRNFQTAEFAVQAARYEKERAEQLLAVAERADAAEKAGDLFATHLAAIIEHGEGLGLQDGHCPLCAAERKPEEFAAAIAVARKRLADRGVRLAASAADVNNARSAVDAAQAALTNAARKLAEETERRLGAEQRLNTIQSTYSQNHFNGPPDNSGEAQRLLLSEQERLTRLERALYILEASSAVDRVASLEAKVAELRQRLDAETARLEAARKAAQAAKQIDTSSQTVANQILTEQFDTVMPLLKELYRRLRPHSAWTEIDSDFGGKVRASLNLTVGEGHNIQFLFSSGQRRAAGLAFLLAIHLSRRWCGWKSLLLDDPIQHIDNYRALNLVEVLAAIRRSGRQVIVAVEDLALADLLCRRLRSTIGELGRRFELQPQRAAR